MTPHDGFFVHDHQWNLNFVSEHYDCRCGACVSREELAERGWTAWTQTPAPLLTMIWMEKDPSNAQLRHAD